MRNLTNVMVVNRGGFSPSLAKSARRYPPRRFYVRHGGTQGRMIPRWGILTLKFAFQRRWCADFGVTPEFSPQIDYKVRKAFQRVLAYMRRNGQEELVFYVNTGVNYTNPDLVARDQAIDGLFEWLLLEYHPFPASISPKPHFYLGMPQ